MGKKKKIAKILDALRGIVGDDASAKKLKKKEAFETFLEKLEDRKKKVEKKLDEADPGDKELVAALREDLELIRKSIKKGERILGGM